MSEQRMSDTRSRDEEHDLPRDAPVQQSQTQAPEAPTDPRGPLLRHSQPFPTREARHAPGVTRQRGSSGIAVAEFEP
jgi:hypothetical protein